MMIPRPAMPQLLLATPPSPGAIAILQLIGSGSAELLEKLIGRAPTDLFTLCDLDGIDEGLVVAPDPDWTIIMPHGGPRVIQKLTQRLLDLGARRATTDSIPLASLYPEAPSPLQAEMLHALASASSPAAIDHLLAQPRLWQSWLTAGKPFSDLIAVDDPRRHWLVPPLVVLVGEANVGKSTLTNLILGRSASITADLPGTTRDWVGGLAELPTPTGPLVVRWADTPGIRETTDHIEQSAIGLAKSMILTADCLISVRDPGTDHLPDETIGRSADLYLLNKADRSDRDPRTDELAISALHPEAIEPLGDRIASSLGLESVDASRPWAFSAYLQDMIENGSTSELFRHCGLS